MKKTILLLLLIVFFPSISGATIEVSGSAIHGQSLTITDTESGFGTKTTPAPVRFDSFEDGTAGQSVTTEGYWSKRAPATTDFNADTLRNSKTTQNVKVTHTSTDQGWFYRNGLGFGTSGKAYINFWIYTEYTDGDASWPLKAWRCNADANDHNSRPSVAATNVVAGDDPATEAQHEYVAWESDGTQIGSLIGVNAVVPTKTWINISMAYELSTLDTSDGNIYFYTSNAPTDSAIRVDSWLNIRTRTTASSNNIDGLALGYQLTVEDGGVSALTYFDNVYIDNSWTRVEIGDNATYGLCTHREIQIETSHDTGTIELTVNQGSFANGGAFLHVTKEDGTQPYSGIAITLADAPASTATFSGVAQMTGVIKQ